MTLNLMFLCGQLENKISFPSSLLILSPFHAYKNYYHVFLIIPFKEMSFIPTMLYFLNFY